MNYLGEKLGIFCCHSCHKKWFETFTYSFIALQSQHCYTYICMASAGIDVIQAIGCADFEDCVRIGIQS